ncbi:MAG: hypothetical protein IKV77_00290 [Alistipes sp.]|nr:hypothetical protein [Alistipes sp.]
MKKSFKELKTRSILSNIQMQNVVGGINGHGDCGYLIVYADGRTDSLCGISRAAAEHMLVIRDDSNVVERYWCCDSCASTSYCGN